MPYTDPSFEQRRVQLTQIGPKKPASVSPVPSSSGFIDPQFEARRTQIYTAPQTYAPVTTAPDPITTPTPQPNVIQQAGSALSSVGQSFLSGIQKYGQDVEKVVKGIFTPKGGSPSEIAIANKISTPTFTPDQVKSIATLKVGDKIPGYDLSPAANANGSAKLTKAAATNDSNMIDNIFNKPTEYLLNNTGIFGEGIKKFASEAYNNPIETLVPGGDILTLVKNTKPELYKKIESNPVYKFEESGIQGIIQGALRVYANWNPRVETFLDKEVQAVSGKDDASITGNTIGNLIGTIGSFILGGEITKGLDLGKAALPAVFTVLGQTSLPSSTPAEARVRNAVIDAVSGTLLEYIKPLQNLEKLGAVEKGVEYSKQLLKSLSVMGTQVYLDARSVGANNQQALEMVKHSALLLLALHGFMIAGKAGEYVTRSNFKEGSAVFTPEQARAAVVGSNLENTDLGNAIMKASLDAEVQGKSLQIDMTAAKKSKVAGALNLETPNGVAVTKIELVEAPRSPTLAADTNKPTTPGEIATGPTTPPSDLIKPEPVINPNNNVQVPKIRVPETFNNPAEKKAFEKISANPDATIAEYEKHYGNEVSPDLALTLLPGYEGHNAGDLSRASGAVKSVVLNDLLDTQKGINNNTVYISAGGAGSGKTTGVQHGEPLKDKYAIIIDTTFSSNSALEDIKKSLKNDYKVNVAFTFRPPEQAWENGALKRIGEEGRVVSEGYFLQSHIDARKNIVRAYNKYKDNPNVSFKFFENTPDRSFPETKIDTISEHVYNREQLARKISVDTNKAYEQGKITKAQYEAVTADRGRLGESSAPKLTSRIGEEVRSPQTKEVTQSDSPVESNTIQESPTPAAVSGGVIKTPEQGNQHLRAYYNSLDPNTIGEAWYQVMLEMDAAEPGQKLFGQNGEGFIGATKSTFPEYIPDELRRTDLFRSVMDGLQDPSYIEYPPNFQPRKQALYDAVLGQIDARAGSDSTNIIEKIKEAYAKRPETRLKKVVDRSFARSEGKIGKELVDLAIRKNSAQELAYDLARKLNNFELGKIKLSKEQKIELQEWDNKNSNTIMSRGITAVKEVPSWIDQAWKESQKSVTENNQVLGFNPKNLENPFSPKATEELTKIVKQSDIAKTLSEKLDVPLRRGKFRSPGAIGIYKSGPKVIRLKSGGLNTVFHEAAHHLDDSFEFYKDIDPEEIDNLVQEYNNPPKDAVRRAKEAFAEYLRFRMTGQTEKIAQWAPKFDEVFDTRINSFPEIKDILTTATNDYKRWADQPAVAKILSQLSIGSQSKGSLKDRAVQKVHEIYTSALDDLHPLSDFSKIAKKEGITVPTKEDPYVLARNLRGWVGKADLFLNTGTFGKNFWSVDKKGKTRMNFTGKSYSEIMKPIEEMHALDEFRVYIVAERIVNDLAPRDIKTGISVKDASTALHELDEKYPEFKKISEERRGFKDRLLDYAREQGLLGPEGLTKMRKLNKFHVPFYRVMEESGGKFLGKTKVAGNVSNPIKRMKGSEREIIDPLESDVKDVYAIINAAERNAIGIAMANVASKNSELGRLFEEVDKPMKATTVGVKEVLDKALKGTEAENLEIPEELADAVVTLFRTTYATGPNMLNVNMGDKQRVFEVDSDLFKALQGLNAEDVGILMKIMSIPATMLRAGATLSPDFTVRNPLRDQFTAFAYSRNGFIPGVDLVRGMFELFKKGDAYNLWKAGGGEHAMFVSLDRKDLQKNLEEVLKDPTLKDTVVSFKNPLKILQIISEFGEAGTRLGEMKRALENGLDPIEAAYAARNVTLDFSRIGAKTKALNMIDAFFNANIQGTDAMIRNFKEKPFQTLWKVFLGLTLPSILLYLANRKDPRWKEIPQWQKDLFWIVLTPNHIWRIPKPFELGVLFGSVPERILEVIDSKDPEKLNELENTAIGGFTPGFLPTGLIPIIENITNYSFFMNRPIVSPGLETLPAEQQSGPYTTEVSKLLGKALNYSPAKIDNLINGYSGGIGKYAVSGLDKILTGTGIVVTVPKPASKFEDLAVIKAFLIKPPQGTGSESVNKVYNKYNDANSQLTYAKKLLKEGDAEAAKTYLKQHQEAINAVILGGAVSTFSELNKGIDLVRKSKSMSPQEKTAKIDEIQQLQTDVAQKVLDQIKKN